MLYPVSDTSTGKSITRVQYHPIPVVSPDTRYPMPVSFKLYSFPSCFKVALVMPLIKKSGLDAADLNNYRPISNLSTISKIMEKLMLARIKSQIINSPNFFPFQSAYRSRHSTETALVKIVDDLLCAIDQGSIVVVAGLDLSAAFDTVCHTKLCSILSHDFGIGGSALHLIQSYLSDRSQFVKIGNSRSQTIKCTSGVPQGSVLGPLLFTAYVSPVGRLASCHNILHHFYADDTQLYNSLTGDIGCCLSQLTDCSLAIHHWFLSHDLLINPTKSEAAFFGTRQRLANTTLPTAISIAGVEIPIKDSLKILGVSLDKSLTFSGHIQTIVRSCNYHLQALRHIRPLLTRDVANTLACSVIGSRVDYCNGLLFGSSSSVLNSLQRVQNNIARVVIWNKTQVCSSTQNLRELHWLPIRDRVSFKVATLCYHSIHSHQPVYLASIISEYKPAVP